MDGFALPAMNTSPYHPYSRLFFPNASQAVHTNSRAICHSTKGDSLTAAGLKRSPAMLRTSSGEDVGSFGFTRSSAAVAMHANLERRAERAQDLGHLKWSATTDSLLQRAYNFHRELRTTDSGFQRECYLGSLAVGKHPMEDIHQQFYARAAVLSSIISASDRTHMVPPRSGLNCGDHFRTGMSDNNFRLGRAHEIARLKREYYSHNLSLGSASRDVRRPDLLRSRSNPTKPGFKVAAETKPYLTHHSEQKTLDYSNFHRQLDSSHKLQKLKASEDGKDSDFVTHLGEVKSSESKFQVHSELTEPSTTTSTNGVRASPGKDDSAKIPISITAASPENSVYPTLILSPAVSEDTDYNRPCGNSRKLKPSKKRRERLYHRQKLASRDGGSDQPSSRLHASTFRGKVLRMRKKPQEGKSRSTAQWLRAGKAERVSALDDHDSYNSSSAEHEFEDDSTTNGDSLCGKTFTCSECRYRTDRKNNLKRHVVTMHQKSTRVLECCGSLFHSKASLRDHVALFHRGGYRCQLCGRNFCRKALLRRHLTVHSGQKDFSCHLCGYATSHKSNLERHQRVHARKFSVGPSTLRGPLPFVSRPALEEHAKGAETYNGEPSGERYQGSTHESFIVHHVDRRVSRSSVQQHAEKKGDLSFPKIDNMDAPAQRHGKDAQDSFIFDRFIVDPLPPPPPPHHHLESEDNASSSAAERINGSLKAGGDTISLDTKNNTVFVHSPSPSVAELPYPSAETETQHKRTASAEGDPETPQTTASGTEEADTKRESSVRSPGKALSCEPRATLQTKNETVEYKAREEELHEELGLLHMKENVYSFGDRSTPPELMDTGFTNSECLALALSRSNSKFEECHVSTPTPPPPDLHAGLAAFEFGAAAEIQAPLNLRRARDEAQQTTRRVLSRKSCFPNRLKETHIASEPLHANAALSVTRATTSDSSHNTVAINTYDDHDKISVEASKENRSPSENPKPSPEVAASTTGPASAPDPDCAHERKRKYVDGVGRSGGKATGEQVHSSRSRMCCRPYYCFGCGVSFAFQGALRSHVCRDKVGGGVLDFPLISAVRKGCIKLSQDQETNQQIT